MNLKALSCTLVLGCLAFLTPGCADKEPPPATPAASPTATAETPPGGDMTATLSQLTQALRKYSLEKQRLPASMDELVTARYVTLPQAPPGQKFAIDAATVQVVLVKK